MTKIMIVDDEKEVIESVRTVLEPEGYDTIGAESGGECIEKLEKEPVDLVLMDFFMPGMDGRMVIEKIRKTPGLKDTKIAILTSATFRKKGIETMKELDVLDYITKPIDMDEFISRIRKILLKNNER